MLPDDPWFYWWLKTLAYAALATMGGVLGYVMRTLDKGTPIKVSRAVMEGLAAGFTGVLMLLACQAMGLSLEWTGFIVGLSGWMGANWTIKFAERLIENKVGVKTPAEKRDDNDVAQ